MRSASHNDSAEGSISLLKRRTNWRAASSWPRWYRSDARLSRARRLSGSISYAQHLAVTKGIPHRIYYNLDDGSYWIKEVSTTEDNVELNEGIVDKKSNLPEGVIFMDITTPRGKMSNTGISYTEFLPKGTGESSAIHIASGEGKVITVEVKGYMVRPRIKDAYSE